MHRSFPTILTLLLILTGLIVIPLKWMKPGHPLASEDKFDLCRVVQDGAVQQLPSPPLQLQATIPELRKQNPPDPSCYISLAGNDAETPSHVWVTAMTQRTLALTGIRQKTDAYVDIWLKESAAVGYVVTPIEGPWRRAAVYHLPTSPQAEQLLADDDGVILWFNALNVGTAEFQAFAAATARRLREAQS
jgi:hypothetical protein